MSYRATVILVMIASPGDVLAEREASRDVVHDWNVLNSSENGAVLLPVGWETHVGPELGKPAQELINERVLTRSDLLVGIFWKRIGTPTGGYPSGSVEEIEKHLKAGKPVLAYFSDEPPTDADDASQVAGVRAFREWCKTKGIVRSYVGAADFERKFRHDLALTLRDNSKLKKIIGTNASAGGFGTPTIVKAKPGATLLEESRQLLVAASKSNGVILRMPTKSTMSGLTIQVAGKDIGDTNDARSMARWKRALDELIDQTLVENERRGGSIFKLTDKGYELADKLIESGASP